MKSFWGEVASLVWKSQWQQISVVVASLATLVTTPRLSLVLQAVWLVLSVLLIGGICVEFVRAVRLLKEKHVPLLVLVGKDENVANAMWQDAQRAMARWDFDAERYRWHFDVEREDVFLHREAPLPEDPEPWVQLAKDFRRKLERVGAKFERKFEGVGARTPCRRIYHIFLDGPASLAAGLGASIGTKYEIVFHHLFPGTSGGPYHAVADFHRLSDTNPAGIRLLKNPVEGEFRYVEGASESATGSANTVSDLYVSVWLAQHDPRPAVEQLAEAERRKGRTVGVFHVVRMESRGLKPDDDWILCAREIITLLHRQYSTVWPNRLHIFLSTPVALAFLLGMGIDHQMHVTVYNWFATQGRYAPILPLERLARCAP